MTHTAPARVVVVDDDPLARRVLREELTAGGLEVVAEASSGTEGVRTALHHRPDVVVMDVLMPTVDGIEATKLLHAEAPDQRVLLLTSGGGSARGLEALAAGADGVVDKSDGLDGLPAAVRALLDGQAAWSRRLTADLVEQYRRAPIDPHGLRPVHSELTTREWEVLDLLCRGLGTADIADDLVLSIETVRSHVKKVLRKLGVSSRAEAIALARDQLRDREPALA